MKMSSLLFITAILFCVPAHAKSNLDEIFDKLGVQDKTSFVLGIASAVAGAASLKVAHDPAASGALFGLGTSLILVSSFESGGSNIGGQAASAIKFLTVMVGTMIGGIFGKGIAEGHENNQRV